MKLSVVAEALVVSVGILVAYDTLLQCVFNITVHVGLVNTDMQTMYNWIIV